ncbi:MAG: hypothetical protein HY869_05430 [Chloroflexi bacterium]|nr:hypothetical protein [Chloroflexota bacterium]
MQLYEILSGHVAKWREAQYKNDKFPAIAEILEHAASSPNLPIPNSHSPTPS